MTELRNYNEYGVPTTEAECCGPRGVVEEGPVV
jgi:hypothetical protein